MFLNLLETQEEKYAFIQMATIIAIANAEDEVDDLPHSSSRPKKRNRGLFEALESATKTMSKQRESFDARAIFDGNKEWDLSSKERAIVSGFIKEMDLDLHSFHGVNYNSQKLKEIIDEMSPTIADISRLTEEEKRIEIINSLIQRGIDWDSLSINPQTARAMMIELLGVALVDDEYHPLEKVVVNSIAQKLNVDTDELEEMEDFIHSFKNVYKSGLEIVNN